MVASRIMGAACRKAKPPLNQETAKKLDELFTKMDLDKNKEITRAEAEQYFKSYAKISANAMFNEVDSDHNASISKKEFMDFWQQVKDSGYSDADIVAEVDEMLEGGSWVDWKDGRGVEGKDHDKKAGHGHHIDTPTAREDSTKANEAASKAAELHKQVEAGGR